MLKLGRYWPWKTVSSHLNKSQKNCCCYRTKCKDYVKVCHILFPFVFNPVASCALEPNYQGMVLTVTILILSGFIFDSSYDLIMLCLCVSKRESLPRWGWSHPKSKETYDPLYFTVQEITCCEWFHKNRLIIIIIINNINSACSYAH